MSSVPDYHDGDPNMTLRDAWRFVMFGPIAFGIFAWIGGCGRGSGQPAAEKVYGSSLSEHAPQAFEAGRDGWSDGEAKQAAVALAAYYKGKRVRPLEGKLVSVSPGPAGGTKLELADKSMVLASQKVSRIAYNVSMSESESAKAKALAKDADVDVAGTVSAVSAQASSGQLDVTFQLDGATFE